MIIEFLMSHFFVYFFNKNVVFRMLFEVLMFVVEPRNLDGFVVQFGVVQLGNGFFSFGVVFDADKGIAEGFLSVMVFCDFNVRDGVLVEKAVKHGLIDCFV